MYVFKDISEETGRLLVHWMYTQKVDVDFNELYDESTALVELWIAGEKLLITSLQNAIIEEWHKCQHMAEEDPPFNFDLLRYVYKNTAEDSYLRRFLVDLTVIYISPNYPRRNAPLEFLLNVVDRYASFAKLVDMDEEIGMSNSREQYLVPISNVEVDNDSS